jgi:hypothetical protein
LVEARLLSNGYAEVAAEGVEHGGANASAGGRPVTIRLSQPRRYQIAQQISAEEAARLLSKAFVFRYVAREKFSADALEYG